MAITVTLDKRASQAGGAIGTWLSRGKKMQTGTLSLAAGATFTASSNLVFNLAAVDYVEINDASGYSFEYNYDNAGVMGFGPDGAAVSVSIVTGYTAIAFLAVGN